MKCFVYGTLLNGMSRFDALLGSTFLGIGFTKGDLYDLGDFPGMVAGNGTVYGELYEVDDEILSDLDRIEGFFPGREEYCIYLRETVEVTMMKNAQVVLAWAYFYNRDLSKAKRIECGDYRRYLLDSESGDHWYIAYGSNMDSNRLRDRVGEPAQTVSGYLDGYRLVFNKTGLDGHTYSNIEFAGPEHRCPVAAYALSHEQLKEMDGFEGEPLHYVRLGLPFYRPNRSRSLMGYVYIARPDRLTEIRNPAFEYLEYIKAGYREHGFDGDCQRRLETVSSSAV